MAENTADLACTPSHARRLLAALASPDRSLVKVVGADRYYAERRELLPVAVAAISTWMTARGF